MAAQPCRVQSRNQEGQILVLTSVSMIALLGIMALSLDASFMYEKRNRLHAAADAAAKSAAIEIIRNSTVTQASLEKFADQQVIAHGFQPARQSGTTSVVVNRPPSSGPFAGNVNYVEAIVSESTSTFFANVLGWISMTPLARAVAGAGNPSACIIIVEDDLTIGNTALTLNGCGAAIAGDLNGENPNSRIVGTPSPPVGVAGTCVGTCGNMGSLTTGAPTPVDPLEDLALPANPGGCGPGTAATLPSGCYTSIADTVTTLSGGGTGIYYITGRVDMNANLSGTNVMLYLTGAGQLTAQNNRQLDLTAPATGPYAGIAIFQDPANANNFETGQNFTLNVMGAIYMPGADVVFQNSLSFGLSTCTLFIAKSLSIRNGNGSVRTSGCASAFGSAAFLTASIAQ